MPEVDRMTWEEAEKMQKLVEGIVAVIEGDEKYTYKDVMRALNALIKNYEEKGHKLLNSKDITEIAAFGGLNDLPYLK